MNPKAHNPWGTETPAVSPVPFWLLSGFHAGPPHTPHPDPLPLLLLCVSPGAEPTASEERLAGPVSVSPCHPVAISIDGHIMPSACFQRR